MEQEFSEAEIKSLKEIFSMFDRDGDGTISASEISCVIESTGAQMDKDELEKLLQDYDVDGDGSFSFHEFLELVARSSDLVHQLREDAELRQAFDCLDRDGDGFLTAKEIFHVMRNLGEDVTREEVDKIVNLTDDDGDGKIEFKEFVRVMKTLGKE